MTTAEQWIKCTQAQKDELNNLYDLRHLYVSRRKHMVDQLNKARNLIPRKWRYSIGLELWIHPVHVRYEAAREAQRLCEWLAHTIARLGYAINEVLREAERGHEQRQLTLHLLKGSKS